MRTDRQLTVSWCIGGEWSLCSGGGVWVWPGGGFDPLPAGGVILCPGGVYTHTPLLTHSLVAHPSGNTPLLIEW